MSTKLAVSVREGLEFAARKERELAEAEHRADGAVRTAERLFQEAEELRRELGEARSHVESLQAERDRLINQIAELSCPSCLDSTPATC